MKKLIIFCAFFAVLASACSKDEPEIETATDFTATAVADVTEVQKNETAIITVEINRPESYFGQYFITCDLKPNADAGSLQLYGNSLEMGKQYDLYADKTALSYKANSSNFQILYLTVADKLGNFKKFEIEFNKESSGEEEEPEKPTDYSFTVKQPSLQRKIQENESVSFALTLQPGKDYQGAYYLKYNQVKGNGFGELMYDGVLMAKNEVYMLETNSISITYKALSPNYHQLDITVFDEADREVQTEIIFNEDKRGIDDTGFTITHNPYSGYLSSINTYSFKLKKNDLDYTGKYWVSVFRSSGSGTFYQGTSPLGAGLNNNSPVELMLNSDNSFNFCYWNYGGSSDKVRIDIKIYDEYNNTYTHTIAYNL